MDVLPNLKSIQSSLYSLGTDAILQYPLSPALQIHEASRSATSSFSGFALEAHCKLLGSAINVPGENN